VSIYDALLLKAGGHAVRIAVVYDDHGHFEYHLIEHYLTCKECEKNERR